MNAVPLRAHLFRFGWFAHPYGSDKYMAKSIPIGGILVTKLKRPRFPQIIKHNVQTSLLFYLTHGGDTSVFIILEFSSKTIPLSHAKTTFFQSKQHRSIFY